MFSKLAYAVFEKSIQDYHQFDNVDQPIHNPYPKSNSSICCITKTGSIRYNGILKTSSVIRKLIQLRP